MGKQQLQEVIGRLPTLTEDELEAVKTLANHLQSGTQRQGEIDKQEDDLQLFYVQTVRILSNRGIRCQPWYTFRKLSLYRDLRRKFPEIEQYTQQYFGTLPLRKRQRLYQLYAVLIADWISQNPAIPLTLKNFINHSHRTSEFVANAFPQYAEAGWLPLILGLLGDLDHADRRRLQQVSSRTTVDPAQLPRRAGKDHQKFSRARSI